MIYLRSALFTVIFPLWTVVCCTICTPLLFLPPLTYIAGKLWSAGTVFLLWLICGIRMQIKGKEHLPPLPFIIASKHQSAWDTAIFLFLLHAPAYVLKKELLKIPFFGTYLKAMKMIAVDRSGKASALKELVRESNNALAAGRPVVIFPEGTRSAPGETPEYHPGIAALYSKNMAPVVPVALNSGLFWGRNAFRKYPGTITLEFLPPIYPGLKRDEFMAKLKPAIEEKSLELLRLC